MLTTSNYFGKTIINRCCWLIFLVMLAIRLSWLSKQTYPISTDGFYYLLQFRSIAEFGSLEITGNNFFSNFFSYVSPTLWFGGLITKTGLFTPEQTFHLIVGLLLIICAYSLLSLTHSTKSLWFAPLFTSSFVASDLIFYRLYAFPRQGTAMSFFLLSLAWLLANRGNNIQSLVAKFKVILALTLTALSHITGAIIVISFFTLTLSRVSRLIAVTGIIGIIFILILLPASEPLFLSSIFHIPDMLGLKPTLIKMCYFANCSQFEWFELLSVLVVTILFSIRSITSAVPLLSAILIFIIICNLPIWNDDSHLSFRLAVCSLWIIWFFFALIFHNEKSLNLKKKITIFPLIILSIFILSASFFLVRKNYRSAGMPPEIIQKHSLSLVSWIPEDGIIEAPHGSQFKLTYFLKRKSVQTLNNNSSLKPAFKVYQTNAKQEKDCFKLPSHFISINKDTLCVRLNESWIIHKIRF